MIISVSNLAWDNNRILEVLEILKKNKISNVEGVLSKIDNLSDLDESKLNDYKMLFHNNNISITSLQSIFHGLDIKSLNNDKKVIDHLNKIIEFSKILGVRVIVLGSPNLRKKNDFKSLKNLFKSIDSILYKNDITLCIEPNSKIYGGDYFYTVGEIIDFLSVFQFKNIKTMIDTHNLILEGDDPIKVLNKNYNFIGHIHISEVNLKPIINETFHRKFFESIQSIEYKGIVTYELLNSQDLEKDIYKFTKIYSK